MTLTYQSTRGQEKGLRSYEAILNGMAADGGLYVPSEIPTLKRPLADYGKMTYIQVAEEILSAYLPEFDSSEIGECLAKAYGSQFDVPEKVVIHSSKKNCYHLELFHGPTAAFKDMALQLLPHLLRLSADKANLTDQVLILTATSGDTGKAALSGFADVPGTKIAVVYPKDGVSTVQELMMQTQMGGNLAVFGIDGNFDDAQTAIKKLFDRPDFIMELKRQGIRLSSANSINIGRLVPQIVYYVYAYSRLVENQAIKVGQEINVVVPTGNFGNILAAYYARQMGIPIHKLIAASNDNKVICDFLATGHYDRRRIFLTTSSPSMDILISSNLERLLYHLAGSDSTEVERLMAQLTDQGHYQLTEAMYRRLSLFIGGYATEDEVKETIGQWYQQTNYCLDPHTAVATAVYEKYQRSTADSTVSLIAATASPYKFPETVYQAVTDKASPNSVFECLTNLEELIGQKMPASIAELATQKIRHQTVCRVDELANQVLSKLGTAKQ